MISHTKRLTAIGLLFSLLWLYGCAVPTELATPETKNTRLSSEQGVITMAAASTKSDQDYFNILSSIVLARLDVKEPIQYRLTRAETNYGDTAFYVGTVPAGDYQLVQVNISNYRYFGTSERTEPFTIKPKQHIHLGLMVARPNKGSRFSWVIRPGYKTSSQHLLKSSYPKIAKTVRKKWKKVELGDAAARSAYVENLFMKGARYEIDNLRDPYVSNNGHMLVAAPMGTLLQRRGSKTGWKPVETDAFEKLYKIIKTKSGKWLAGGDAGLFLVSTNRGKTWKQHRLPINRPVYLINQAPNGMVYVGVSTESGTTFYRTRSVNKPRWKKIGSVKTNGETAAGAFRSGLLVWTRYPAYKKSSFDSDTKRFKRRQLPLIHRYSYSSGRWTQVKPPEDSEIVKVGPTGIISVGINWYDADREIRYMKSTNLGRSWKKFDGDAPNTLPVFWTNNRAVAQAPNRAPMITKDNGDSWRTYPKTLPENIDIIVSPNGKHMAGSDSNGRIFVSNDGGRTWQYERSAE